ncbi:peroxidasin homolog [Oreochromis niloticus]|uniref:peroxidasin homolog n=1 Tax=Oreochromis niloticus TaxID=8128 RepID=UPI000DF2B4C7|nr:peroxidasin homolog [Oreochromis niloticus]
MGHSLLCMMGFFLLSTVIRGNAEAPPEPTVTLQPSTTQIYSAPPKPTVTLQPSWTQIYSGETVTVRCEIQGGEGAQWTYGWRPAKLNTPPTSNEYRIIRAAESDGGGYSCRGRRSSSWTEWSDITLLKVTAPPKPTVTLQPSRTQIYSGETVTVRCEIQGGEGAQWTYEWRRGQASIRPTSSEYRIIRAAESDGVGYSCRGRRGSFYTQWSDITTLRVTVPTKPTVTLQPSWTQIYSGETVTVRCEIQGGEGAQWTYGWRPAKLNTPPTSNEYRIIRAAESDGGGYSCRGRRSSSWTEWSDITLLKVTAKPKAELRADRTAVPVGGSVTLTCSVNPSSSSSSSSRWKYYWYRDGKSFQPVTNGQISVSEGGLYSCRGGRGEPVYYTEDSESVRIDTTASNRPVVTLYPNWSEIYRGETITVRCEIHGGDTEWDYEWETNSIRKPPNQNEYRIRSASSSNSGNYRCKGRMKSSQHKTTEWSDSVTLTVSDSKSYLL